MTRLEVGTFNECTSLASIVLPEGMTEMGDYAFHNCRNLASVSLPTTLDSIGERAFFQCYSLDSVVLPDRLRHLGVATFGMCTGLKWCHLPAQMEYVDKFLFYKSGIRTIEIPEGVVYIDTAAFGPCLSLRKVTLPASLVSIRGYAFQRDRNIDTIILACTMPPTVEDSALHVYNTTLSVPCGTAEAYRQHPVWGRFSSIVEECNAIEDACVEKVNVYVRDGRIMVEGADGEAVSVYDMMGRKLADFNAHHHSPYRFSTGMYMVKVGNRPARKVVVVVD